MMHSSTTPGSEIWVKCNDSTSWTTKRGRPRPLPSFAFPVAWGAVAGRSDRVIPEPLRDAALPRAHPQGFCGVDWHGQRRTP